MQATLNKQCAAVDQAAGKATVLGGHTIGLASGQTKQSWPLRVGGGGGGGGGDTVYLMAPGPRFETRAEIRSYIPNGSVVGMTCGTEWTLASELMLPYVLVCAVDNSCNGLSLHPGGALQEYLDHKGLIADVTTALVTTLVEGLSARALEEAAAL
eukprot:SAG22_NODE_1049_length_5844_cov_2.122520_3_plen_155_part_00